MQGERDVAASGVNSPVTSPGYGGISEGTVGEPDPAQPARRESSAEHRSSWPDEGGTGEAGTG
jgi:hypothetical protein